MIKRGKQHGQAVVFVTLALIVMFGMLGLAVDLGWSYFMKKSAQAAADSAAMGAAVEAFRTVGQNAPYTCGAGLTCQPSPSSCPASVISPSNNLETGCLYARQNGFSFQGHGGRQNVTISADTTSPAPTVPGVGVYYWVTARVLEGMPQLFSAVLGNTEGVASARSTAAIAEAVSPGSLYALNRENDPGPSGTGTDIFLGGGGYIDAKGGVYMASTRSGSGGYAGESNGNNDVYSSFTNIRGDGSVQNPATYQPAPTNGWPDTTFFQDPMRGKGQPLPPTLAQAPETPISGGTIDGNCGNPRVLSPGTYYATGPQPGCNKNCATVATGAPIQVTGCVQFSAGGSGFANYVFFGGLQFPSTQTQVSVVPGRYVMAGALSGNPIFYMHNGVSIEDQTPRDGSGIAQPNSDAGEIFIFTDAFYPGLQRPPALASIEGNLQFGLVDIQMGNTSASSVDLHGLNRLAPVPLPDNLATFAPTVFWMDQRNSEILYTADGQIQTNCGGTHSINNPCMNSSTRIVPEMHMQAYPNLDLFGAVYLPRGADLTFQGHGTIDAPMQVVAGTVNLQGGPSLTLLKPNRFITRRIVSLVE